LLGEDTRELLEELSYLDEEIDSPRGEKLVAARKTFVARSRRPPPCMTRGEGS